MQIWKNPIGRIQNFLNSSNLIGQNKPALDVCDLTADTPSSQLASSSRLFRAQRMVASLLKMYGCTTVNCLQLPKLLETCQLTEANKFLYLFALTAPPRMPFLIISWNCSLTSRLSANGIARLL
jgi:hypothetical protein